MRVALLHVNVALFDPAHPNLTRRTTGWATSTITINGCVRVLSSPAYPTVNARREEVVAHLRRICRSSHHEFWSDSTQLSDPGAFRIELIGDHRKITDVSLLALACRNKGRLATFDRSIPLKAVVGAENENLLIIGEPARPAAR